MNWFSRFRKKKEKVKEKMSLDGLQLRKKEPKERKEGGKDIKKDLSLKKRSKKNKKSKKGKVKTNRQLSKAPFFARMNLKDKTLFAKRLSFLVQAGVPLLESLHILKDQMKSHSTSKIFDSIIVDVQNGQFLHTSLRKFERVFGEFAVNIIKVGETSGVLSDNLAYLADELKKRDALKKKVLGSLVYPIFITVATIGVSALLTAYIFPKIMPIFSSLSVELPITTRALIWVSDYLRDYGFLTLIVLIIIIALIIFLHRKFKGFHEFVDRIILKIPVSGKIALNYNLANFCRTIGILLKGGMTITEALEVTGDTMANRVYKKDCYKIAKRVRGGGRISESIEKHPKRYPSILTHMVSIGEKTGSLSDTMIYLSDMYEAEVDELTKNLSNSIEPVLMIFMGIIVGFVAVSVITPIYEVTKNLQR